MKRLGLALALLGFFFATAAPIRQVGQSTTQPSSYTHVDLLAMPDSVLTGTTTVNASTTVTGTGTLFLSEVHVGDRISVSSAASTYVTVTAIASNISLTVSAVLGDGTSQTINVKHAIWRALNAAGTPVAIQNDLGSLILQRQSLGTTSTDGLVLENTTAAAAGAQQISSRVRWTGRGWETDTGSSQQTDYVAQLVPVQGAAAPQARLDFNYQINAGGYQATPTISLLNGDVGVKTATPKSSLEVVGSRAAGIQTALIVTGGSVTDGGGPAIKFLNGYTSEDWYGAQINTVTDGGGVDYKQDLAFYTNSGANAADIAEKVRITSKGNILFNTTSFGTSAAKALSFGGPATAPTTRPADIFTLYPFDVAGAGTMGLAWMSEDNGIGILGLKNGFGTITPSARITSVQAGAETFLGLSGAAGNHTSMAIGRTAAEARLAIVAVDGEFAGGSLSGDAVLRVDSATNKLHLLAGTGNAMWTVTSTDVKYGKALVALGGGAAPTLGTIGGSGPTVAAQNAWIQMQDSTGANVWIAVWK